MRQVLMHDNHGLRALTSTMASCCGSIRPAARWRCRCCSRSRSAPTSCSVSLDSRADAARGQAARRQVDDRGSVDLESHPARASTTSSTHKGKDLRPRRRHPLRARSGDRRAAVEKGPLRPWPAAAARGSGRAAGARCAGRGAARGHRRRAAGGIRRSSRRSRARRGIIRRWWPIGCLCETARKSPVTSCRSKN